LEEQALNYAKTSISGAAPALFGFNLAMPSRSDLKLEHMSSTVRLEVGIWLRQQVAQHSEVNEQ
jgi:mediator of RNA polymerase II transcription subunit 12